MSTDLVTIVGDDWPEDADQDIEAHHFRVIDRQLTARQDHRGQIFAMVAIALAVIVLGLAAIRGIAP